MTVNGRRNWLGHSLPREVQCDGHVKGLERATWIGVEDAVRGAIEAVMTDPVFRSIFIILIIQGVAFGSQMPFMPLWATERLGVGPVEVGTISLVTSLATTAFGLGYGVVTDRTRRRVPWLVVAFGIAIPLRIAIA